MQEHAGLDASGGKGGTAGGKESWTPGHVLAWGPSLLLPLRVIGPAQLEEGPGRKAFGKPCLGQGAELKGCV